MLATLRQAAERYAEWRRTLRLPRARAGQQFVIDRLLERPHNPAAVRRLLRLVLTQSLHDTAVAVHFFHDDEDDCLRMLYCLPVTRADGEHYANPPPGGPADPPFIDSREAWERWALGDATNPAHPLCWFEIVPPPSEMSRVLFRLIHQHARITAFPGHGLLPLRYNGRNVAAAVSCPTPADARLYYPDLRPPIHAKLPHQFGEPTDWTSRDWFVWRPGVSPC